MVKNTEGEVDGEKLPGRTMKSFHQSRDSDIQALISIIRATNSDELCFVKSAKKAHTIPAGQTIRLPCRANTGPIHRKTPVIFKPDELATRPSGLEVHESLTTIKEGDVTILSINVGLLRLVHSVTPVEVRFKNTETQTPDKELPCEEHKLTEKIESNLS